MIIAAERTNMKHQVGSIVASIIPIPSASKNKPIVFLNAPKNIIYSPIFFDFYYEIL